MKSNVENKHYSAVHWWLRKNGKEKKECNHCGKINNLEQALKTGEKYEKNPDNFIILCRSCHRKYDMTEEMKIEYRKRFLNLDRSHKQKPIEGTLDNKKYHYRSVTEAIKFSGVNKNSIHQILSGQIESCKGWKFKYKELGRVIKIKK